MRRALLCLLVTFTSALQQPRTMSAPTKRLKSTPVDVELVPVGASEVAHLHSLEAASYPADEAASLESFVLRQREAGAAARGGCLFHCGRPPSAAPNHKILSAWPLNLAAAK